MADSGVTENEGGLHQVKPWFEGRLEFAPVVDFEGLGYFRDRTAAVFVYARRLHPISLLVFRAEGLAWPARGLSERGFHVIMWRRGGLGYALVSDVDGRELRQLAARLADGP